MSKLINFVPKHQADARLNLREFVDAAKDSPTPLGLEKNRFENSAWSILGLVAKGGSQRYIYFVQRNFDPRKYSMHRGVAAVVPVELLLRGPFLNFAKVLMMYLHTRNATTLLPIRIIALRYLEEALLELTGSTCPTSVTPEVMFKAQTLAATSLGAPAAYSVALQLNLIYKSMSELCVIAVPSQWRPSLPPPMCKRARVGKQFDDERQRRLPSPLALHALAEIFSSETRNPTEIFASSMCALMLCAPDRAVEALFAPLDIFSEDWRDEESGEIGTGLRWFPAKGAVPLIKTVVPAMRGIAIQAVNKLKALSEPARELARWYERNPNALFLPPELEHLRYKQRLSRPEIQSIVFGNRSGSERISASNRLLAWLDVHGVPRQSNSSGTTVAFADLERAIILQLPPGFPILDANSGLRYSEALCIVRVREFDAKAISPSACCFRHVCYTTLKNSLKSSGANTSIFEKRGYVDSDGEYLFLSTHMLRHYLNTLVRRSGTLTEVEIARWSGRMNVSQNSTYNHMSDRDVLAKLRGAVGDPSRSLGPFSHMEKRVFISRDSFAAVKVLTAHTSEFGHCIHDYAQSPCQVFGDCINCSEQVCIKGDVRASQNLRRLHAETVVLQERAQAAFSADVLGASDWYGHQTLTLSRICELIKLLDDPAVPYGAVIQLADIESPSRLDMIARTQLLKTPGSVPSSHRQDVTPPKIM